MFERFTDRARRVVVLAQEEARILDHNYIGTEHLLLGLVHEEDGIAARVLHAFDVTLDAVRDQVEEIVGRGQSEPASHIPFTPRAKKVLELSLREALQLGHSYIGTEHILLGLVREGEGLGARVLRQLGVELDGVHDGIVERLGSPDPHGGHERRWFRRGRPAPSDPARGRTPSAIEQLDDAAWEALVAARRAARQRGAPEITARDLLMGVVAVPGPAADALRAVGTGPDAFEHTPEADPADRGDPPAALPYSAACRAALDLAVEESRRRRHAAAGTSHLLHALLQDPGEQVEADLDRAGIAVADLRAEAARRLD